jgi:hypothetical protein
MKDVQAAGETFCPQKRTSSTSKREISFFFMFLLVIFALLNTDQPTKFNVDPDPEHGTEERDLWEGGL